MPRKGFIPVQFRASQRSSPLLFERLNAEPENGEPVSSIVRRLAEEALLLREHPLIKAVQVVDLKGVSGNSLLTPPAASKTTQTDSCLTGAETVRQVRGGATTRNEAVVTTAKQDGSSAMAALLVDRGHGARPSS